MLSKQDDLDANIYHPELSRHFPVLTYNRPEMSRLIAHFYDHIQKTPSLKGVVALLNAAIEFRSATTTKPYFAESRNKNNNMESLITPFKALTAAFNTANRELNQLDKSTIDYQLMADTLHYCAQSITNRLDELKASDDIMYRLYLKNDYGLKECLTTHRAR